MPRFGVTNVGEVANTATPVPVSSESAVKRLDEVKEPSTVAFPVEVICPVKLALVVTLPAVRDDAVPVSPVPKPAYESAVTAPKFVTWKGEVAPTEKRADGVAVLIPTLPPLRIWSLSLEPVLSMTSPVALASESPVMMASEMLARLPAEPGIEEVLIDVPSAKMSAPPEPEVIRMSPVTWSLEDGLAVPIPMLVPSSNINELPIVLVPVNFGM